MENRNDPITAGTGAIMCRGVRGATTASENTRKAILEAAREMLYILIRVKE
jgi:chorismate mutase